MPSKLKYLSILLGVVVTLGTTSNSIRVSTWTPEFLDEVYAFESSTADKMTPPSSGTQDKTPPLPTVTETQDKQGNTILSSNPTKNVKVETPVKRELTQDEKDFNRGYVRGVALAFIYPSLKGDKAEREKYTQIEVTPKITAKYIDGVQLGFLAGLVISDTFSIKADVPKFVPFLK